MKELDLFKDREQFTIKLLFNDKLIVTTDKDGNEFIASRNLSKFPFYEPEQLGNNHLKDKRLIQDSNNNPHPYELNIFENSWEAVEMGEKMIEAFRLYMRVGTEDYIERNYQNTISRGLTPVDTVDKSKDDYFTIVITNNLSLRRDDSGKLLNITPILNKIQSLTDRQKVKKTLSVKEEIELEELNEELKSCYISREIYRCSFSACEYSYDGVNFTPPINKLWKDFNIYFKNSYTNDAVQYVDYSEYSKIINTLSNFKIERKRLENELEESTDNVKTRALEKSLNSINQKIKSKEMLYFKGLRTILIEYLNLNSYENRYINPRPKNSNFVSFSSENEITKIATPLY